MLGDEGNQNNANVVPLKKKKRVGVKRKKTQAKSPENIITEEIRKSTKE